MRWWDFPGVCSLHFFSRPSILYPKAKTNATKGNPPPLRRHLLLRKEAEDFSPPPLALFRRRGCPSQRAGDSFALHLFPCPSIIADCATENSNIIFYYKPSMFLCCLLPYCISGRVIVGFPVQFYHLLTLDEYGQHENRVFFCFLIRNRRSNNNRSHP